jgi:type IX secretion system substrate protein
LDTNGSGYKNLHDFDSIHGMNPISLTLSGNVLFGMTNGGGAFKMGCIFSVNTNGYDYNDLMDFNQLTNGAYPLASLIISGKVMYGTAQEGPPGGPGCIFSIDTNGSGYQCLFNFNSTDGAIPASTLVLSGDNLYGTTTQGGADTVGVVFKFRDTITGISEINSSKGAITVFPNPSNGRFTIQSPIVSGKSSVEIYNVLGQKVFSTPLNLPQGRDFEIDLSNQSSGIYLYRVITEHGELVGSGKLIIK